MIKEDDRELLVSYSRNDWFPDHGDVARIFQEVLPVVAGKALYLLDVCSSCKGTLATCNYNGNNLRISIQFIQSFDQFILEPYAEGIESLRPVEGDQAHPAISSNQICLDELAAG